MTVPVLEGARKCKSVTSGMLNVINWEVVRNREYREKLRMEKAMPEGAERRTGIGWSMEAEEGNSKWKWLMW